MSLDRNFHGSCPASLSVVDRSDGSVRFRVGVLGGHEASVDLSPGQVDELVRLLTELRQGASS